MKLADYMKFLKNLAFIKILLFFIVFSFSLSVFVRPTYAIDVGKWVHDRIDDITPDINIVGTIEHAITSLTTDYTCSVALQVSADEAGNCGLYNLAKARGGGNAVAGAASAISYMNSVGIDNSQELLDNAIDKVSSYDDEDGDGSPDACQFQETAVASRTGGSLASVGLVMHNTVTKEPLPVNLAYFFQDYARRMPLVKDTAYAQTSYNALGLELVLDLWKTVRNLSYGIVSIAMLIVGIMIMTRQKISPQAVVTVQNALPRVVISLILITFSYPIGATLASLTIPLILLVHEAFFTQMATEMANINVLSALFSLLTAVFSIGLAGTLLAIGVLILSLIIWLVALIRVLLAYVRILILIIIAPLQFAMGAIPGKESAIKDWFKQILANVLAIPAMYFMIGLAWYVLFRTLVGDVFTNVSGAGDPATTVVELVRGGASRQLTLLFAPLMMIFCLATSMKMPGLMKKWIVGDKKK